MTKLTEKDLAMEASRGESSKQYLDAVRIIKHFKRYDHDLAQLFSDETAEIEQAKRRHQSARKKILSRISNELYPLIELAKERTNGINQKYLDVTGARLKFVSVKDRIEFIDEKAIVDAAMDLNLDKIDLVLKPEFEGLVHFVEPKIPVGKWKVNKDGFKKHMLENGEGLPDEITEFVDTHDSHENFSVVLEDGGSFIQEAMKEIRTSTGDFIVLDSNNDAIELSEEVLSEYD